MTARGLVAVVVLLVWYSTVGHIRATDWTSELALWTRAVKISPTSPRSHINRAKALFGQGREDEAITEVGLAHDLEAGKGEQ